MLRTCLVFLTLLFLTTSAFAKSDCPDRMLKTLLGMKMEVVTVASSPINWPDVVKDGAAAELTLDLDTIKQHEARSVDDVVSAYRSTTASIFVVIDPEFMLNGKPKYNPILASYRDGAISADNTLLLDPIIGAQPDKPIVALIDGKLSPQRLIYVVELAAMLIAVPEPERRFKTGLMKYGAELTYDPLSEGTVSVAALQTRKKLLAGCGD